MSTGMIVFGIIVVVLHLMVCIVSAAEIKFFDLIIACILFCTGYYGLIVYLAGLVVVYLLGMKSEIDL